MHFTTVDSNITCGTQFKTTPSTTVTVTTMTISSLTTGITTTTTTITAGNIKTTFWTLKNTFRWTLKRHLVNGDAETDSCVINETVTSPTRWSFSGPISQLS
jgi:hypothetical protein